MTRLRTQWMAALGAGLLLALSVSSAFGALPETAEVENRGQQVSAYVHSLLLGSDEEPQEEPAEETDEVTDEQQDEETDQTEEVTDEQTTTQDGAANSHGQCVSEVARGTDVGGPKENHGGAVSQAAREDCWQTDTGDGGDAPTEVSDGPGNSESHGSHGKNK